MKKAASFFAATLALTGVSLHAAAETQAETQAQKYARCQAERQACIDKNQYRVTTNSFGVKSMPVDVVKQCGDVYADCMGIKK